MVSAGNGGEIDSRMSHPIDSATPNDNESKIDNNVSLEGSIGRKGLLSGEKSPRDYPNNVTGLSGRLKMLKINLSNSNLASPLGHELRRMDEGKDELPTSTAATVIPLPPIKESFRKRFNDRTFKKIRLPTKAWMRKPVNMLLLLWLACVGMCGFMMFLLFTGILDSPLPKKSQRDRWFEVCNQIIVALITLMCLCHHPARLYHSVLLCRWNKKDISKLRKVYCKNGTIKPSERFHIMIVLLLLNINFCSQYVIFGLNVGFSKADRPKVAVILCLVVNMSTLLMAGLYAARSPLGKDSECDGDEETPRDRPTSPTPLPREYSTTMQSHV